MPLQGALQATLAFVALNAALVFFMVARRLAIAPGRRARRKWHSVFAKSIDRVIAQDRQPLPEDIAVVTPRSRWQRQALEEVLAERADLFSGATQERLTAVFEGAGVVAARMAGLKSRRVWTRRYSAQVLGDTRSDRAVPALLLALRDPDEDVRTVSAAALGKIGATSALPYIASLFRDLAEEHCISVADTIVSFGARARVTRNERINPLAALLDDPSEKVRYWATRCLGSMAKVPACLESKAVGDRLIARLVDESTRIRAEACRAVGALGICAEAPRLERGLKDPEASVRCCAATSLGTLMDPRSAPALVAALGDDDFDVGQRAARALFALDEPGVEAAQRFATTADGPALMRAIEVLDMAGLVNAL